MGGRPSGAVGRPSAPNGSLWTAVWLEWMVVCPQRKPLDDHLLKVDSHLVPTATSERPSALNR
ncbi:unnamed protein product [Sphenostylis stenocarpa]|uniref:Uncharacterized protein n=1 Tax=Sphenostylis stenocarpa TaxID=92480 RepID=A0AA86SLU9_9FABA|nr:unnamed protein product [Sphenostylis stenocarpa]